MFIGHESLRFLLWDYVKYRVHSTNAHTLHELQAEIESVAEEITGDMMCDTFYNFAVRLQQIHKIEGSHIAHVFL